LDKITPENTRQHWQDFHYQQLNIRQNNISTCKWTLTIYQPGIYEAHMLPTTKQNRNTLEPLAKLSAGQRNKLIKAPDKPVF
jgi:hypothetical protein